jgi:signal transduction histidine kinase
MIKKIYNVVFMVGALSVLVSSVLVMENVLWGKYVFAVGAAFFIVGRMRSTYEGTDFRLKRLNRLYFISSLFLLAVSYMQFRNIRSWVVVLLMVALTELYAAVRLSWYEREQQKAADAESDAPVSVEESPSEEVSSSNEA